MANFPVVIYGRRFNTAQDLAEDMVGRSSGPSHSGHFYAADYYDTAKENKKACRALGEAATLLLATSERVQVVRMATYVGGATHKPFYETLLNRLQTNVPPVPDAEGAPTRMSLREDMLAELARPTASKDKVLHPQIRDQMIAERQWRILVNFLTDADPGKFMPMALAGVLRYSKPNNKQPMSSLGATMYLAGRYLAKRRKGDILVAIAIMKAAPKLLRDEFKDGVERSAADWLAKHATEVKTASSIPKGDSEVLALTVCDPDGELVAKVTAYFADNEPSVFLAREVGTNLAKQQPAAILEVARALAIYGAAQREAFYAQVVTHAADWLDNWEKDLLATLRL